MALLRKQVKSIDSTSALGSSPLTITFDDPVEAGSLLIIAGGALANDSYTFSNLSSVTDSRSNTWETPVNVNASGTPAAFFSYAMNVAAGTTTITINLSVASNNRYGITAFEYTGMKTTGALDLYVSGSSGAVTGTTVSTAASAVLAQTNNAVILVGAGAFGDPSNTSGYTEHLSVANGGTKIGVQVMSKATASTDSLTGVVTHESVSANRHAILAVFKEDMAAAATTYRFKFQLDSAAFTSADTGITGYVWQNATPNTAVATVYTGLAGDAVAGDLYVTPASQAGLNLSTTVMGIFFNGTDTSGLITGITEEAP